MIVWGWRNRRKQVSEGWFHCPRCDEERTYVLQKWVRWFTLYFLPLFPTGTESPEHVTCGVCGSAFDPSVLEAASITPRTDATPPAAWYLDPAGSGQSRWWNGESWTSHVRPTA